MKRIGLSIAACALLFTSCQDAPEADKAEATEAKQVEQAAAAGATYTVDPAQSTVEWVGTKPVGRHHGTFTIKQGSLTVANNNIAGGRFVVDINSIKPDDQDAEGNKKLQGHLLSGDFFEAQKYPEGVFEITSVTPIGDQVKGDGDRVMENATHTVTGNLTLKDVTKSITFPAVVSLTDNQLNADASFNIDRTQWNMVYGNDKSLGDKFIRPEVNMKIHLIATKQ
jgi:polyisoprenoid-binding protein YceI